MKSTTFWDVMPCSLVEVLHFGGTLVNFYQTTRRHIPENGTLIGEADRLGARMLLSVSSTCASYSRDPLFRFS
jgi:hypothetical protein